MTQPQTAAANVHPDDYRFLREFVFRHSGIVLGEGKEYLFESRLAPVLKQCGLATIRDLCALLRATREPEAGRRVVEAMTTNETYFFRDPAQYEAIRQILLPRLRRERQEARRLRFWSAAASTGQEAYSLAMALLEDGFGDWDVQILGTDISGQVLERARAGLYHQIEVNRGLPAPLLVKYFQRRGVEWELRESVRRLARFELMDLRGSLQGFGPFDLVFCRNVLIYFDASTRESILRSLRGALVRGGWLLLGGTETAFGIEEWFERQQAGSATVYVAR
jgi:chemotaxis protein methyltransferase CheR